MKAWLPGVALALLAGPVAALEAFIHDTGLVMTLPPSWGAKYEQSTLPNGQPVQRWVRESLAVAQGNAAPGLVAVSAPVPKDADLARLSQTILSLPPHGMRLGVDTQCVKCVTYRIEMATGTANAVAPTAPPNCTPYKPDIKAACLYQAQNPLGLPLEPSWANRYERDAPYGKSYTLVVHALYGGRLVDLTFVYPKEAVRTVQPEIARMLATLRKAP